MAITITVISLKDCNYRCHNANGGYSCIGKTHLRKTDRESRIDFEVLAEWLQTHHPGANVHVSGGEPLMHECIDSGVKLLIDNGHDVTILTNGAFLPQHPALLSFPVKWHVSWHRGYVSAEEFADCIEPLKNKPHVVSCVLPRGVTEPIIDLEEIFPGFNHRWIKAHSTYLEPVDTGKLSECPNDEILMIGPRGEVFACSFEGIQYGNIYDNTFDAERAAEHRCICLYGNMLDCNTILTAKLMEGLK